MTTCPVARATSEANVILAYQVAYYKANRQSINVRPHPGTSGFFQVGDRMARFRLRDLVAMTELLRAKAKQMETAS